MTTQPRAYFKAERKTSFEPIEAVTAAWGRHTWDILVAGDGSGHTRDDPMGWGAVLVDRARGKRRAFRGSMSTGTNYLAEILPYVQAIDWYASRRPRSRTGKAPAICRALIVSDNSAVVETGNALTTKQKLLREVGKGRAYWAAIFAYESDGFVFDFHLIKRQALALNCWCDAVAHNRFKIMQQQPERVIATTRGTSEALQFDVMPADCNPDPGVSNPLKAFLGANLMQRRTRRASSNVCEPERDE